jgi:hypothetical protein
MTSFLKSIFNDSIEQKLAIELSLDKLTTRKVNQLRQRENRAKILEKTRNISETNENNAVITKVEQSEEHVKQEISKYKRKSVKLNEIKRQNEENKIINKIKSMTIINRKKSTEESNISKPIFRVSKIIKYDDKHLYQQPSSSIVQSKKL